MRSCGRPRKCSISMGETSYIFNISNVLEIINLVVSIIFVVCYSYQVIYIPLVLFFRRKKDREVHKKREERGFHEEDRQHDFALLICGRNEEAVIGDLIDSIHEQTYPQEYLHIFVLADNCTDSTAKVAAEHGAVVYERFNKELIGKGYALAELLKHLEEDYPAGFDGYFVFDADNLLAVDFIDRMNDSFCDGNQIITCYRNSKNHGTNWLSAASGLWFLRESVYLNNARFILGTSCNVSGTGFFFSRAIREEVGDWPFHLLTEDIEFSIDRITSGQKIVFCPEAELYDEQPTKFWQSFKQRHRWGRGYLQVLHKYAGKLIKGIFHGNFSCFDIFMNIAPAYILSTFSVAVNLAIIIFGWIVGGDTLKAAASFGVLALQCYSLMFIVALVTTITEWKRMDMSAFKKILYIFTFPIFMLTYVPVAFAAIFKDPSWQPIKHTMSVKKMEEDKKGKKK